jgi:hypothetical protein
MLSCCKAKKAVSLAPKGNKSIELFKRYAGALKQTLIDEDSAWHVFFYLFQEKVYSKNPTHSAYNICKSLNSMHQANPPLNGAKLLTGKSVDEALETLVTAGFVIKRKVKVKAIRKSNVAGRPPKYVYEVESIAIVILKVKEKFQKQIEQAMEILQPLQDMEEAAISKKEETN